MQKLTHTVIDSEGRPIANATVSVYVGGTNTLATLYADDELTAVTNPLTTNSNGFVQAKVPTGTYDIESARGGVSVRVNGFENAASGGGGGVTDGDKGDIVVSAGGAIFTVDNGAVNTAKLGGDITTAGKALLDDANAAAQRTTLGLGTAATAASGDFAAATHTHTASQITDLSENLRVFIQDTLPTATGPYLWIDTTGGNLQFKVEDGL